MQKILIVEDDIGISNSLKLYLENSNYKIELCNNGNNALDKINEIKPHLIILDINLPGKNGMQICKELREKSTTPVIMLTARDSEYDRISGLEIGADDYIAKPFSPRELLARIVAILKRVSTSNEELNKNILRYKNIFINLEKKIVEIDGSEINLTKNEYELFEKIVSEDGKVLSREILMTDVLGYDNYVYDRTLDTHIKNLRKKIDIGSDIILTIRGEGYRLNK